MSVHTVLYAHVDLMYCILNDGFSERMAMSQVKITGGMVLEIYFEVYTLCVDLAVNHYRMITIKVCAWHGC